MRSSTSSLWPTHRIGTAASAGVERISLQTSKAVLSPVTTSMIASWWSATLPNASAGSAMVVTV